MVQVLTQHILLLTTTTYLVEPNVPFSVQLPGLVRAHCQARLSCELDANWTSLKSFLLSNKVYRLLIGVPHIFRLRVLPGAHQVHGIGSGVHRKKGSGVRKTRDKLLPHFNFFIHLLHKKKHNAIYISDSGIAHRKLALGIFTPTLCRLGAVFFKANRFRCRPFGSSFAYLKQELSPQRMLFKVRRKPFT